MWREDGLEKEGKCVLLLLLERRIKMYKMYYKEKTPPVKMMIKIMISIE